MPPGDPPPPVLPPPQIPPPNPAGVGVAAACADRLVKIPQPNADGKFELTVRPRGMAPIDSLKFQIVEPDANVAKNRKHLVRLQGGAHQSEYVFGRLLQQEDGRWRLKVCNPAHDELSGFLEREWIVARQV